MGRTIRRVQTCIRFVQSDFCPIVPTLCVGMQRGTLCVPKADAERPLRHSHAGAWERSNKEWDCCAVQREQAPSPQVTYRNLFNDGA